ncbi:MAG TPA: Rv3235 family protein [Marmoricola sp.]
MNASTVRGVAAVTRLTAPARPQHPPEVQGALALDLDPHDHRREPDSVRMRALSVPREDLEAFAKRFCTATMEVLSGDRGPAQLLRWVTPPVYLRLVNRSRALAGAGGSDQRLRQVRAHVHSVHVFSPSPGCAEFSMHVRHGARSRAVAGRLEVRNGAWTCVALQFG